MLPGVEALKTGCGPHGVQFRDVDGFKDANGFGAAEAVLLSVEAGGGDDDGLIEANRLGAAELAG